MKSIIVIVLIFLAVLAAPFAYLKAGQNITIPFEHQIDQEVIIGDGRLKSLNVKLDGMINAELEGDQLIFSGTLSHRQLYKKILTAFESRARSGYTRLARENGIEPKWRRLNSFSIAFNPDKQTFRTRANAKIRLQSRIGRKTGDWDISLETHISIIDGYLYFNPESLNIKNVPGELNKLILASIDSAKIPLTACLKNVPVHILSISYKEGANSANVSFSVPSNKFASIAKCFALNKHEFA